MSYIGLSNVSARQVCDGFLDLILLSTVGAFFELIDAKQ